MDRQDRLFTARIDDKIRQSLREYDTSFLGFLTPGEQIAARRYLEETSEVSFTFSGGYADAERAILMIKPENGAIGFPPADEYLSAVRITSYQEGKTLGHRDYLGSLIGMGLKREAIGDLLPYTDGKWQYCDAILLKSVRDQVCIDLERIGRTGVRVEPIGLENLHIPEKSFREIRDTVASVRLDAVVSAGFSIGRAEAKSLTQKGLVSLNYEIALSPDAKVEEGDMISARGSGKLRLEEIGGETKKQRVRIVIRKYI